MSYTVNITGTAQVPDSIIQLWNKQFEIALSQERIMDQFVNGGVFKLNAAAINISKYNTLPTSLTALSETDDVTSIALSETPIQLVPAQYGEVVTKTELSSLQTNGLIDLAAAWAVGENMGRTMDALALTALNASSTVKVSGNLTASTLTSANIMNPAFLEEVRNKLAKQNAKKINGMYAALMSDDCIADLMSDTSPNGWVDVLKYSNPTQVLSGEVGSYKGFRVVRHNLLDPTVGGQGIFTNANTVPAYTSFFLGANALGKAASQEEQIVFSGPFDKLSRFVNIGWKTTVAYKIIQSEAVVKGITTSSFAGN